MLKFDNTQQRSEAKGSGGRARQGCRSGALAGGRPAANNLNYL